MQVDLLRQVLNQTEMSEGENAPLAVLSQGSCYQLNAPGLWIDVEEFEQCCALGRACDTQGKSPEARAFYARAADLYRGDFLEELADDWPTFRREALKDQYLFVLARLATAATEDGDYHDGIMWCQRLLAKDRCREDTYRMLMLCHAHWASEAGCGAGTSFVFGRSSPSSTARPSRRPSGRIDWPLRGSFDERSHLVGVQTQELLLHGHCRPEWPRRFPRIPGARCAAVDVSQIFSE